MGIWFGLTTVSRAAEVGSFFEPDFPFFHSQVEVAPAREGERLAENFVVRGVVIPLSSGHVVLFDQELLRVAAIWRAPSDAPPITPKTMAQISYASSRRKVGADHPEPTGPLLLSTAMHPGAASNLAALRVDPRPPNPYADHGRGPLPQEVGRFDGIDISGGAAVLHYHVGPSAIREWHTAHRDGEAAEIRRHVEIGPRAETLYLALGAAGDAWTVSGATARVTTAEGTSLVISVGEASGVTLVGRDATLLAEIGPSATPRTLVFALRIGDPVGNSVTKQASTVGRAANGSGKRWPQTARAPVALEALQQNGLVLDRIAVPEDNPWHRRIRPADIAFLEPDRAAVVTYDGDVWLVDGLADHAATELTWRRFASGLHESLAIARVADVLQVATKNGVVRLHDRDGNGEADWYENFNDHLLQSQSTRSFPLDMGIGPDGSTYIAQGGIVTRSGIQSGGDGTRHTGAILRIAPDGRASELFADAMREPFVAVDPETGLVTATDQQGHFIPSSVAYLVRRGDSFGFLQPKPEKLTPPLAWLPHDQDISSSSQVWLRGAAMGPWDGKLLHLSYGNGRLFIVSPDLEAPVPQGAVIPLDLKTDLPLLHGRMSPRGDAVYFAGFQIWGTRTLTRWSLGRLRPGRTPIVTALGARSIKDGLVIEFAAPLQVDSAKPGKVQVRAWNYRRSAAYGSGRYALDGQPGATALGVAQTIFSPDRRSLFVHVPGLVAADQVELRHDLLLASGAAARGTVYFTIHAPTNVDPAAVGFPGVDLTRRAEVIAQEAEPPATPALGKTVAENLGCFACHSVDGSTEGKVGPTWRGLFGSPRTFSDGTTEVADELYLREKILDPQQKKLKPGQVEMPSYRGVMSEQQLEAVVLYIKSIGRRVN